MKKEKKYAVMWKGARIVEANNKKELLAKINSPNFSRAIKHVKKIDATLGRK